MEFGVDGMLYVTTGDAGQRALGWAAMRNNLHGSIIRITDSGEIPADNPYIGEGTGRCNETGETTDKDLICQEIFAYGLRNPFRFTMDAHSTDKVRFMVNDVGQKTWEEISVGGTDYAGANYGWPYQEGPCDLNSVKSCSIGENTGLTDPFYWYQHDEEEEGCAVGIAVPPVGSDWPSPYNDPSSFFFVDFVWGNFYHVTEDEGSGCNSCAPPTHSFRNETFHEWGAPIGLKFGPYIDHSADSDGDTSSPFALYYTYRENTIYVKRIVYKGGNRNNYTPTVSITSDKDSTDVGGTITFDALETTDLNHEMDELTFTWDFGDGTDEETGVIVSHQFESAGRYRVMVTVVDPQGAAGQSSLEISVGPPPTVEIVSPTEGTMFAVGDVLTLFGTGLDYDGSSLDESTQMTWEVRQHHANHFHPFLDEGTPGNNLTLTQAPSPEDFFAVGNSYLEILLTGTSKDGVPATVSRRVMPKTVDLDFETIPAGLLLSLDEAVFTMPQRVQSWEKHNLRVVIPEQDGYVFEGWYDAFTKDRVIVVPANNSSTGVPKYTALFELNSTALSEQPSDLPSSTPTFSTAPSLGPTFAPSLVPSGVPSLVASSIPSMDPSASPRETEPVELANDSSSSIDVLAFWLFSPWVVWLLL